MNHIARSERSYTLTYHPEKGEYECRNRRLPGQRTEAGFPNLVLADTDLHRFTQKIQRILTSVSDHERVELQRELMVAAEDASGHSRSIGT